MDKNKIDKALLELVKKKNELSQLTYADENYDDVEEELHDLEDDFIDEYGDFMEDVLEQVHGELKIDSDVLSPIAYIAQKYNIVGKSEEGKTLYEPAPKEGVPVQLDLAPNADARLVFVPSPARLLFTDGKSPNREVWNLNEVEKIS